MRIGAFDQNRFNSNFVEDSWWIIHQVDPKDHSKLLLLLKVDPSSGGDGTLSNHNIYKVYNNKGANVLFSRRSQFCITFFDNSNYIGKKLRKYLNYFSVNFSANPCSAIMIINEILYTWIFFRRIKFIDGQRNQVTIESIYTLKTLEALYFFTHAFYSLKFWKIILQKDSWDASEFRV